MDSQNEVNQSETEKEIIKEEINGEYVKYSSEPEKIFKISSLLLRENKFEEGIEALESALKLAIRKYNNPEAVETAIFYRKYGDGIVSKLLANNEILNINPTDIENDKQENSSNNINTTEKKEQEEEVGDEQIAFENIALAEKILLNFLSGYTSTNPSLIDPKIRQYFLQLGDVYVSLADLEKVLSNTKETYNYYEKAIDIFKKYDDKFSRTLAGTYFEYAQVLEMNAPLALLCLYKTKIIMEYHLQKELDKVGSEIKLSIREQDLDLPKIEASNKEHIYLNKEKIESEKMKELAKTNADIEEFYGILCDIYPKLEDVILEIDEFERYMKAKEAMKEKQNNQSGFNAKYDESKIVDLSNTNLIKKKRKEPENDKEDIDEMNKISGKKEKKN